MSKQSGNVNDFAFPNIQNVLLCFQKEFVIRKIQEMETLQKFLIF